MTNCDKPSSRTRTAIGEPQIPHLHVDPRFGEDVSEVGKLGLRGGSVT